MFENQSLCLSGLGYLHDIRRCHDGKMYITLNVMAESEGSQSDEIWVECQVGKNMFSVMAVIEHLLATGKKIILNFDAIYSGFRQSHAGITDNDPDFIVQLQAQLLNIYEFYVKEEDVSCRHKNGSRNAMVSLRQGA